MKLSELMIKIEMREIIENKNVIYINWIKDVK